MQNELWVTHRAPRRQLFTFHLCGLHHWPGASLGLWPWVPLAAVILYRRSLKTWGCRRPQLPEDTAGSDLEALFLETPLDLLHRSLHTLAPSPTTSSLCLEGLQTSAHGATSPRKPPLTSCPHRAACAAVSHTQPKKGPYNDSFWLVGHSVHPT